jgi:hypothetical protein
MQTGPGTQAGVGGARCERFHLGAFGPEKRLSKLSEHLVVGTS